MNTIDCRLSSTGRIEPWSIAAFHFKSRQIWMTLHFRSAFLSQAISLGLPNGQPPLKHGLAEQL